MFGNFKHQKITGMYYSELFEKSIQHREEFWKTQAEQLTWDTFPKTILSKNSNDFFEWFSDGRLNMSYLCLDAHIHAGRGEHTALIYDSPVTQTVEYYTYHQLKKQVAHFAAGLHSLGITKGDTVVIYMPMIPQAVITMLACARIGAIHSVVFGGFAPHELAMRIDDAKPKAIITASHGIEIDRIIPYKPLVDQAIKEAKHKPNHIIHFERNKNVGTSSNSDIVDFAQLMNTDEEADAVIVEATHPLYILYTSGTTGTPKGIVRDTGGYATALKFSMTHVYNAHQGDVFWAASDVGWVVGHSYIVYGPLLNGCTTVLYEGKPVKTPDCGGFWRVVEQHKVNIMFTAPTAIRAIKKEDDHGVILKQYDLDSLKTLFLAGERCDPATFNWIKHLLGKPVIDHWWQTESGWPMLGIMMGVQAFNAKAGSAGLPICGFDITILSEEGEKLPAGKEGLVTVKLPLPPGCLPTLWNNDERFRKGYLEHFPGYYLTGDGGYKDEEGYFFIMGRIDDVINVAGHRLSTGEMEELIAAHPSVAECAVLGIADDLRGQRPVALVVLKDGVDAVEQILETELITLIREKIGAVAFFKNALVVKRLPKTRSGKILRKTLRHIADGIPYNIPSTIEDPESLNEIELKMSSRKLGMAFQ
jgi:acyl-coenzyme A synthetase/AMP-(fatty) acid ligase